MSSSSATASAKTLDPPAPLRKNIAADFALDSTVAFLNHGSFGARPRSVLEAQSTRRADFEASPIEFLHRARNGMIDQAKRIVSPFLGMSEDHWGFVTNATGGVNAVLRSLNFKAGDELVTTSHVYNAVRMTMRYLAERAGGRFIEVEVPLPLRSPDQIVAAIERSISSRTRIVVIDHITSPTAVLFPVEEIVSMCEARGVDVLVDGAHAPGMIPLNVEKLNAAYYTGNLHKWMCAPVGAAFLWARPDKQPGLHPLTISHFLDQGFAAELYWQATRDITPWLCVPDAMHYLERLGWDRVMNHNHQLAVWVQQMLCDRWQVEPATPMDGSMLGSMATVKLPNQEHLRRTFADGEALNVALYQRHRVEVPVVDWQGQWWVRPCCQVYNIAEHYERLADAVLKEVAR